jgi:hypothetical protein
VQLQIIFVVVFLNFFRTYLIFFNFIANFRFSLHAVSYSYKFQPPSWAARDRCARAAYPALIALHISISLENEFAVITVSANVNPRAHRFVDFISSFALAWRLHRPPHPATQHLLFHHPFLLPSPIPTASNGGSRLF